MLRIGLVSALLILILCLPVFAGELNNADITDVIISQEWENMEETSGRAFFLFSDCAFLNPHDGSVILFNSNARISGNISGNVYSFFSEVDFGESASVGGRIYTMSSLIGNITRLRDKIAPLLFIESILYSTEYRSFRLVYDGRFPTFVIILVLCLLRQVICAVIYGFKPGFFQQSSVLLAEDPPEIIQFGLITYFLALATALMFLFSVVGAVISLFIVMILAVMVLTGLTGFEIALGSLLSAALGRKENPYVCLICGGIIVELLTFIPVFGVTANVIFLPILCLGVLWGGFVNGFFRRKFYPTPFDVEGGIYGRKDMGQINKIIRGDKW
ncbi:MAG: hypothetical protein LBU94_02985 [Clostridiales bacterium]|nr:hypothetical protein [Clostridiales bacterium]